MPLRKFTEIALLCLVLTGCGTSEGLKKLGNLVPERIAKIAEAAPGGEAPAVAGPLQAEYDRAVATLQAGEVAEATRRFEQLAEANPKLAGPHLNLALIHVQADRLEQAETSLDAALARNGKSAPAHNLRGIVLRRQGDFDGAERAYRKALSASPDYAHAWRNLGVLYDLYLQQPQRALDAYQHYQAATSETDKEVALWISDLTRRFGNSARSAQAGQP